MPEVNREQFEGLAKDLVEPDGGFSVRTPTGYKPRNGYMVSQSGTEKKLHPNTTVTAQHLVDYAQEHSAVLHRRGRYMGGWHDPKTHDKDLDVSHHHEASEAGHQRARVEMIKNNQDALYDMNKWESEPNHLKKSLSPGAYQGLHSNMFPKR